jgi:hypothetical protein
MCFSAEASFASAGVLAGLGAYCLRAAARELPAYRAFAAVPVGFGIQQAAEGFVWLGLDQGDGELVRGAAGVYLFFALAVWPFWFPLAAALAEPKPGRSRLLLGWTVLNSGWFWVTYLPIFFGLPSSLDAEVVGHSIHYTHADNVVLGESQRWAVTALYLFCTGGPQMAMTRWQEMLVPVVSGGVGVVIAAWSYAHAYTSVWCFFAALLSAYCAWYFASAVPQEARLTGN